MKKAFFTVYLLCSSKDKLRSRITPTFFTELWDITRDLSLSRTLETDFLRTNAMHWILLGLSFNLLSVSHCSTAYKQFVITLVSKALV